MIHFYPFNYWLLAAQAPRPRLRAWPLTYIKRCTLIQLWDMQRSRTRFPRHRHDNNLIVSGPRPYLAQIVWRLWIRITAGHNVLAEFHKSSYKGNIQEFSRLICMQGFTCQQFPKTAQDDVDDQSASFEDFSILFPHAAGQMRGGCLASSWSCSSQLRRLAANTIINNPEPFTTTQEFLNKQEEHSFVFLDPIWSKDWNDIWWNIIFLKVVYWSLLKASKRCQDDRTQSAVLENENLIHISVENNRSSQYPKHRIFKALTSKMHSPDCAWSKR